MTIKASKTGNAIIKSSKAQQSAARLFISYIEARDGAAEAAKRALQQLVGKGKATPEMLHAVMTVLCRKYAGAKATVHLFAGKYTIKFDASNKGGRAAKQFYFRNIAPMLPAVTARSKGKGAKKRAATATKSAAATLLNVRAGSAKAEALDGLFASLKKRLKANKKVIRMSDAKKVLSAVCKMLGIK